MKFQKENFEYLKKVDDKEVANLQTRNFKKREMCFKKKLIG